MTASGDRISETKTGRRLTRRERKALQTRQLILDAARELFDKHPYEDVKMDDISERADLSRATLYNYYNSKEAIYFEIGIQSFRHMSERQKAIITSESSGLDQIVKLSEETLRGLFEQPLIQEIIRRFLVTNSKVETSAEVILKKMELGEEVEDPSAIILARFLHEIRVFEKIMKDAIERGFEDGTIRHDLNTDQLTHFLFMIISGIFDRVHLERVPLKNLNLSVERIITMTVDLIRKDLVMD